MIGANGTSERFADCKIIYIASDAFLSPNVTCDPERGQSKKPLVYRTGAVFVCKS